MLSPPRDRPMVWSGGSPVGAPFFAGPGRVLVCAHHGGVHRDRVWTVPVFGDDSGEPGYSSGTTFSSRAKTQAWRWNLDLVSVEAEQTHGGIASLGGTHRRRCVPYLRAHEGGVPLLGHKPCSPGRVGRRIDDLCHLAPVPKSAWRWVDTAQYKLTQRGQHRAAGAIDLLVCATAVHHGHTVLHVENDFATVGAVLKEVQATGRKGVRPVREPGRQCVSTYGGAGCRHHRGREVAVQVQPLVSSGVPLTVGRCAFRAD